MQWSSWTNSSEHTAKEDPKTTCMGGPTLDGSIGKSRLIIYDISCVCGAVGRGGTQGEDSTTLQWPPPHSWHVDGSGLFVEGFGCEIPRSGGEVLRRNTNWIRYIAPTISVTNKRSRWSEHFKKLDSRSLCCLFSFSLVIPPFFPQ